MNAVQPAGELPTAPVPGLRRRIEIVTHGSLAEGGEARAVLEDDFHHFRVAVRHSGGVITDARADSPRHPYSTCPLASDGLQDLVGMTLSASSQAVFGATDASLQCTHMLDLAGLAAAAVAQGIARRTYEIVAPDRVLGRAGPSLMRDGRDLLAWQVDGDRIEGPVPFVGIGLHKGFARWVAENLDPEMAEAALVLRRAVAISVGRTRDLEAETHSAAWGRCFSQQPVRAASALRVKGSVRDFSAGAEALCADDGAWLASETAVF
ncbi:MAG: hypothetical protein JWQ29_2003 [Phenylobacterium sp.]|nr:hypothetical protein [Phenylobacterium sp.]